MYFFLRIRFALLPTVQKQYNLWVGTLGQDDYSTLGYAGQDFRDCFAMDSASPVVNGASILHCCLQEGTYASEYSNVFDLKSGDRDLFRFHRCVESLRMNLDTEREKGGHDFHTERIHQQLSMPVMALRMHMRRFVIDDDPPISDPEPNMARHLRSVVEDAVSGHMRVEDYHADVWSSISALQADIRVADLRSLPALVYAGLWG